MLNITNNFNFGDFQTRIEVRSEIITLETFIFFSVKIYYHLELGMSSCDTKYNISHLSHYLFLFMVCRHNSIIIFSIIIK